MANSIGKTNRLHPQRGRREGSISKTRFKVAGVSLLLYIQHVVLRQGERGAERRQMPIDNASRPALGQSKTHPSTTTCPMSGSFNARGIIFCGRTVGVKRRAASLLGPQA